jgi:hypothetical protein
MGVEQIWKLKRNSRTSFVGSKLRKGIQYLGVFNRTRSLCREDITVLQYILTVWQKLWNI